MAAVVIAPHSSAPGRGVKPAVDGYTRDAERPRDGGRHRVTSMRIGKGGADAPEQRGNAPQGLTGAARRLVPGVRLGPSRVAPRLQVPRGLRRGRLRLRRLGPLLAVLGMWLPSNPPS